jgi:hypothetical protein
MAKSRQANVRNSDEQLKGAVNGVSTNRFTGLRVESGRRQPDIPEEDDPSAVTYAETVAVLKGRKKRG